MGFTALVRELLFVTDALRPAEPSDVPAIRSVAQRGWKNTYEGIISEETIDRALSEWYDGETVRRAIESDAVGYFVAERDGEVVAYASGSRRDDQSVGTLNSIYVDPDSWGEGIGTTLLDRIESFCRERGCERMDIRVLSENEVGRSFYRKHGYEAAETRQVELFGETVDDTTLRKALD